MLTTLRHWLQLLRFHHTVFALPFAYASMLAAAKGIPGRWAFVWVTVAMVSARTAGMTLNRVIDLKLDAANPRTAGRALPRGIISVRQAIIVAVIAAVVLVVAAGMLNPLCLKLSPLALVLLFGYSFVKRYSSLCHLILGLVLACAPVGGWIAVRGHWSNTPLWLAGGVMLWVAGFDILYALQDLEFDRATGIHSLPKRLGVGAALWLSRIFHAGTLVAFFVFGLLAQLGMLYGLGLVIIALTLLYEHRLISPRDWSRVDIAFFHANAVISLVLLLFTALDVRLR